MDFSFKRHRTDKVSREKIIKELEKAAKHFGYRNFGRRDFSKMFNVSDAVVIREFGTWNKAMDFLKEHFQERGIELKPRDRSYYTKKELFDEMEKLWGKLGHRPSKGEWIQSDSKISYQTFVRYFGGWQNACLKFIEYKMGRSLLLDTEIKSESKIKNSLKNKDINTVSKDSRTIPLGIRLKVLDRDNFRCIFCGCSPATDLGVKLHIDHIISYSKGGKSTLENLQTLCEKCNLGKSNKEIKLVK